MRIIVVEYFEDFDCGYNLYVSEAISPQDVEVRMKEVKNIFDSMDGKWGEKCPRIITAVKTEEIQSVLDGKHFSSLEEREESIEELLK